MGTHVDRNPGLCMSSKHNFLPISEGCHTERVFTGKNVRVCTYEQINEKIACFDEESWFYSE